MKLRDWTLVNLILSLIASTSTAGTSAPHKRQLLSAAQQSVERVLVQKMPATSRAIAHRIATQIIRLSDKFNFHPAFILGIIETESHFAPGSVSNRGAVGLMQLRLSTAKFIARRMNWNIAINRKTLYDPVVNITLGIQYLSYLREQFDSEEEILGAYNVGPSAFAGTGTRHPKHVRAARRYIAKVLLKKRAIQQQIRLGWA